MKLNKNVITQKDVNLLEKTFATKEDLKRELTSVKSDLVNTLDSILKEMIAMREEMTIVTHKVSDHEERITTLESATT